MIIHTDIRFGKKKLISELAVNEEDGVFRFEQKYPIARKRMANWLNQKKLIWKEDIVAGLENAPKAFIGLMNGKNFGKLLWIKSFFNLKKLY